MKPNLFNSLPTQRDYLMSTLLPYAKVGQETILRIRNAVTGAAAHAIGEGATQPTIVVPGMDRREFNALQFSLNRHGVPMRMPRMPIPMTDQAIAHEAGPPRIVFLNLRANARMDSDTPLDLEKLANLKGSYLSSIATVWMIALNPGYANYLASGECGYRYVHLPGIHRVHEGELTCLSIDLEGGMLDFKWLAAGVAPWPSVTPVVCRDSKSEHLQCRGVPDEAAEREGDE